MSAEEKRRAGQDSRTRPVRRVVHVHKSEGSDTRKPKRSAGGLFGGGPMPARPEVVHREPPKLSPERQRWEELTEDLTSVHGRPYDPARSYGEGDIVLHKQFGMGIVEDVQEAQRTMNVLFRDGLQVLDARGEDVD